MTRFLALLAVTCFALVAWGQQTALVGLPEYGVELTGTVQNPTIVNNSGRTIIGHVQCMEYASGGCQYRRDLNTRDLRLNMKNLSVERRAPVIVAYGPNLTPPTFVRVVLDAVVFADGQVVGPDQGHNFEGMAN
jgi:hypothetical protein